MNADTLLKNYSMEYDFGHSSTHALVRYKPHGEMQLSCGDGMLHLLDRNFWIGM